MNAGKLTVTSKHLEIKCPCGLSHYITKDENNDLEIETKYSAKNKPEKIVEPVEEPKKPIEPIEPKEPKKTLDWF